MPKIIFCQRCGTGHLEDRKCPTCDKQPEPITSGNVNILANFLIKMKGPVEFVCEYRNWRGEVATRRLRAVAFWHGSTEWHPKPGLMLKAVDLDKDAERDFAVADFNMTTLRVVPTMTGILTRKEVRMAYFQSGIHRSPLTFDRMAMLRNAINAEMLSAGLMEGTYHMAHPSDIRIQGNGCAELRCESYYFDDREAVTFSQNGFIGFAGWADETNVQPILRGFMNWIRQEKN